MTDKFLLYGNLDGVFDDAGRPKVFREWRQRPGTNLFFWRSSNRSRKEWVIEAPNRAPVTTSIRQSLTSKEGANFNPRQHSVTLEDFVFIWEDLTFVHLATRLTFGTRQLNEQIFRRAHYPYCNGARKSPALFLKHHARLGTRDNLNEVIGEFEKWKTPTTTANVSVESSIPSLNNPPVPALR